MDRTTIMLPPELKVRAANQAKKMGISLGQLIRKAPKKSLDTEKRTKTGDDSLFLDNVVYGGKTPGDLASEHDKYLYGEKK